jgi:hypothetical protein
MELTNTNRSRAYPKNTPKSEEEAAKLIPNTFRGPRKKGKRKFVSDSVFRRLSLSIYAVNARLVAIAEGFHTYPSRTRPLSPPAPMVLGPKGPGRVGRRQADNHITRGIFFALNINMS